MKPFINFSEFPLPGNLKRSLHEMAFTRPTPVQSQVIPVALNGRDVLATAQTGTGKTGAFAIPLLTRLMEDPGRTALILAPTRELAAQIDTVMRRMSRGMKIRGTLIVGGESFFRQIREIEKKPHYIVATPGRLNDHLQQGTIRLNRVRFLVLDEVDRMLDMGFAPQIQSVMEHLSDDRQTLLFSATLPQATVGLANSLLKKPARVAIAPPPQSAPLVEERIERTTMDNKHSYLLELLGRCPGKVLVFARTKSRTDRLVKFLDRNLPGVVGLHGGKTQGQRKRALAAFTSGDCPILVATDIAGRGIDVDDIEHVINFDIPMTREDYVHRIGRTGRNGKTGIAITLIAPEDGDLEQSVFARKKKPTPHSARPGRKPSHRSGSKGRKPGRAEAQEGSRKPFRDDRREQGRKPFREDITEGGRKPARAQAQGRGRRPNAESSAHEGVRPRSERPKKKRGGRSFRAKASGGGRRRQRRS